MKILQPSPLGQGETGGKGDLAAGRIQITKLPLWPLHLYLHMSWIYENLHTRTAWRNWHESETGVHLYTMKCEICKQDTGVLKILRQINLDISYGIKKESYNLSSDTEVSNSRAQTTEFIRFILK